MTLREIWPVLRQYIIGPARRWAGTLARFTLVQAISQAIGAIAGIIVVRLLTKDDYAFYTIANSMLSALVLFADGGVGAATAGIGGRVWKNLPQLSRIVNTALRIRKLLWIVMGVPIAVILAVLLLKNGAGIARSAIIIPIVLVGSMLSLGSGIYIVVPRLLGDIKFLQAVSLSVAIAKLLTVAAFGLIGLSTETAVLSVTIGYAIEFWRTRRWAKGRIDSRAAIDPDAKAEFHGVLRRQLPGTFYFFLQTSISVWLLSIFGSTAHIAGLGALNRISIVFGILTAVMEGLLLPRFARCSDPSRIWSLYAQITGGFVVLVLIPAGLIWLAPHPILWILGPQYGDLTPELMLATLSFSINAVTGLTWALNTTRAWVVPPWIYIGCGVFLQTVLLLIVGASTIRQVLTMAIIMDSAQILLSVTATTIFIRNFRRKASLEAAPPT